MWESERFLGGSCVPLDSVCPFLCEYEPDDMMCFQGAGNMARHTGPLGTEAWASGGGDGGRTGQGTGEWEEAEAKCHRVGHLLTLGSVSSSSGD